MPTGFSRELSMLCIYTLAIFFQVDSWKRSDMRDVYLLARCVCTLMWTLRSLDSGSINGQPTIYILSRVLNHFNETYRTNIKRTWHFLDLFRWCCLSVEVSLCDKFTTMQDLIPWVQSYSVVLVCNRQQLFLYTFIGMKSTNLILYHSTSLKESRPRFNIKAIFPCIGILIIMIWRTWERLIFKICIATLIRHYSHIWRPKFKLTQRQDKNMPNVCIKYHACCWSTWGVRASAGMVCP